MLESIHYQNFQCHEDKIIEFDPHITCLVGETDSGKSSAIRGLIWILLNQPRGDGFITWGKDFAINTLKVDGHEISRGKRKSYNYYTLDDPHTEHPYEAPGTGVPDDVSKLLSVTPISIQRQLDPPFWFLLSPAEVSKELNAVVNLELIDQVLDFFSNRQRRSKTALGLSEDKLTKAKKRRQELQWAESLDQKLVKLEKQEQSTKELEGTVKDLEYVLTYLDNVDEKIIQITQQINKTENLVHLGEQLQIQKSFCQKLEALLQEIYDNKIKRTRVEQQVEELEKKIQTETNGLCPICGGLLNLTETKKDGT